MTDDDIRDAIQASIATALEPVFANRPIVGVCIHDATNMIEVSACVGVVAHTLASITVLVPATAWDCIKAITGWGRANYESAGCELWAIYPRLKSPREDGGIPVFKLCDEQDGSPIPLVENTKLRIEEFSAQQLVPKATLEWKGCCHWVAREVRMVLDCPQARVGPHIALEYPASPLWCFVARLFPRAQIQQKLRTINVGVASSQALFNTDHWLRVQPTGDKLPGVSIQW
jgi:hypothetical protein